MLMSSSSVYLSWAIARKNCAAVAEDFAFHRGIAEATGNPQFPRFLEFLGSIIIRARACASPRRIRALISR